MQTIVLQQLEWFACCAQMQNKKTNKHITKTSTWMGRSIPMPPANSKCAFHHLFMCHKNLRPQGGGRGKAWKGTLNVTQKKKAAQMEANTAIMADVPTMKRFFFMLYLKAINDQGNPNEMVTGKPQNCAFYLGFHGPVMQKNCKYNCFWLGGQRGVEPTTSGLQAHQGG